MILLLGGVELLPSKYVLIILAITIPLSGISYFLGNTVLVVMNHVKEFNMSVIYSTIVYLILLTFLYMTDNIQLYLVTFAVVIVELYTVLYRYYYSRKFKLI